MRGERSSYPKRDIKREQSSYGSSEVKTYKMSPEELEDYRARNAFVAPKNSNGNAEKRGMDLRTKPKVIVADTEQPRRDTMCPVKREGPDKDFVLTRISAGKSISAVERELGMKVNELHYWIRKWDWVGITPVKARAILNGEPVEEVIKLDTELPTAGKVDAEKVISELQNKIADLEVNNAEVVAASGKAIEKLITEIADLVAQDEKNQQRIQQITEDRDLIEVERDQAHQAFNELNEEHLRALDTIEALEAEKLLLLQTIENATMPQPGGEEINHPEHYTAGGIEVIDFIVAKLTAEEFAGYCKGNIMKYVARANLKGGLKDLRKLRWYVDRLIEEVDAR